MLFDVCYFPSKDPLMLSGHAESCFVTSPIWLSVDQASKRAVQKLAQALVIGGRQGSCGATTDSPSVLYHLSLVERLLIPSPPTSEVLDTFVASLDSGDTMEQQGRLRRLGAFLSSSRLDVSGRGASPEAISPKGPTPLTKWISLLVAVRNHAIIILDRLAYLYCLEQAALRYWQWARRNPVSFHAHKLLSIPFSAPAGWWSAIGPMTAIATQPYLRWRSDNEIEANSAAHQLTRLEDWIVKCIGVVHTAMSTMNLSVTAYAASLTALGEDDDWSPTRNSSPDHVLQTIVRKTLANMHTCPVLPGASSISDDESPIGSPTTAGNNFGEAAPTFEGLVRQLRHQIGWFDASRHTALHILNKSDLTVPPGRLWRRMTALVFMVMPIAVYACTTTPAETISHLQSIRSVLTTFYLGYVQEPLIAAINSFTSVRPGTVERKQEIQEDLESTVRMVLDFYRDTAEGITPEAAAQLEQAVRQGDMSLINARYEAAVRHPFRSFFFGSLVRLMLIQIQHQKLEVSRVLSASDDVLESNDFNFKVMALMPFVAVVSLSLHYLATRSRGKRDPVYHRLRLCWRKLSRLLMNDEEERRNEPSTIDEDITKISALAEGVQVAHRVSSSAEVSTGDQGRMLLLIHEMRALLPCIPEYALLDEMLEDLRDVESVEATRGRRLQVVMRMLSTHPILSPLYIPK